MSSFLGTALPVALAILLAGCASPPPSEPAPQPAAEFATCIHPWPCADGSEWPADLAGPFERLDPAHVRVPSFDGVELDGWVWLPELPAGARAPVVLYSTPYLGTMSYQSIGSFLDDPQDTPGLTGSGGSENRLDGSYAFGTLIEQGYAVLIFSVRGTGASGGCYDLWGASEQRDQAEIVQWAATQPWSNGRVGMVGLSYSGTTPWEAAIQAPPGLKAMVVGGIITDAYLGPATPQGAVTTGHDRFQVGTTTANSLQPPTGGGAEMLAAYAPGSLERACPATADILTVNTLAARADERPQEWFDERRLADHFADVTAAVLVAQGFQDSDFHRYQEDTIWPRLPGAPKWFVLGQWGHTTAIEEPLAGFPHARSWLDLELAWFDFWLKGIGDPPRQGVVDFQDDGGTWHESTAWPPVGAREEVLFLADGSLASTPAGDARTFQAVPQPMTSSFCPSLSPLAPSLAYFSEPLAADVVLAGNPFVHLELESDQPGGTFEVELVRVPPGWSCDGSDPADLTEGGADLRFHAGNFDAVPFPVGPIVPVRVDLWNVATRFQAGDRIALSVTNPDGYETREFNPTLKVHPGSHVVLPLVEGTVGGASPLAAYPPRPFT